jgi:hypothetical protein
MVTLSVNYKAGRCRYAYVPEPSQPPAIAHIRKYLRHGGYLPGNTYINSDDFLLGKTFPPKIKYSKTDGWRFIFIFSAQTTRTFAPLGQSSAVSRR